MTVDIEHGLPSWIAKGERSSVWMVIEADPRNLPGVRETVESFRDSLWPEDDDRSDPRWPGPNFAAVYELPDRLLLFADAHSVAAKKVARWPNELADLLNSAGLDATLTRPRFSQIDAHEYEVARPAMYLVIWQTDEAERSPASGIDEAILTSATRWLELLGGDTPLLSPGVEVPWPELRKTLLKSENFATTTEVRASQARIAYFSFRQHGQCHLIAVGGFSPGIARSLADGLRQIAIDNAPAIAYACLVCRNRLEAQKSGASDWVNAPHHGRAPSGIFMPATAARFVPDGYWWQLLGPQHAELLGDRLQSEHSQPAAGGRVTLEIGDLDEWLGPTDNGVIASLEHAREVLEPLLVDKYTIAAYWRDEVRNRRRF